MSEDFHLRCVTCNPPEPGVYTCDHLWGYGADLNHQGDRLLALLPDLGLFASVAKAGYDIEPDSLDVFGSYKPRGLGEFALAHQGHDIRVWSEYGREWQRQPIERMEGMLEVVAMLLYIQDAVGDPERARKLIGDMKYHGWM